MGTRSLTKVYDESGELLVTIYRQYDGYPSGMGVDIATVLDGRELVNGIPCGEGHVTVLNGMDEAAAVLVHGLKNPCPSGNVYIVAGTDHGEEYTYEVRSTRTDRNDPGPLLITCIGGGEGIVFRDLTPAQVIDQFVEFE